MGNGARTVYPHRINKVFNSEFPVVYLVRHTPNEGLKTHRLKQCNNNEKDEDNSLHVNSVNNNLL